MRDSIFQGMTCTHMLDERVLAGVPSANQVIPTAAAVAFVEWVCGEAIAPYLDAGERSVGTRIAFEHEGFAPIGQISADVELIAIEGKRLRFKVIAHDEQRVIGRGLHERTIFDDAEAAVQRRRRWRKAAAAHCSAACA